MNAIVEQFESAINELFQSVDLCQIKVCNELFQESPESRQHHNTHCIDRMVRTATISIAGNESIAYTEHPVLRVHLQQPSNRPYRPLNQQITHEGFMANTQLGISIPHVLEPVIGRCGGYDPHNHAVLILPSGVLREIDKRRIGEVGTKKIVPQALGSWFVIAGRNAVYIVEYLSFALCIDPVVVVTPTPTTGSRQYRLLTPGEQQISLGIGGHVVLCCLGVVVVAVGVGGLTGGDYVRGIINAEEHIFNDYLPIHLRAYRGFTWTEWAQENIYTLVQVSDSIALVVNRPQPAVTQIVFRSSHAFLKKKPLMAFFALPMFLTAPEGNLVRGADHVLRMSNGLSFGACRQHNRATIDPNGNFIIVGDTPSAQISEIRPRTGSLIALSWTGQVLQVPSSPNSSLFVPNLVITIQSSHLDMSPYDSDQLIRVYTRRTLFTLNGPPNHLVFHTPTAAILLTNVFNTQYV